MPVSETMKRAFVQYPSLADEMIAQTWLEALEADDAVQRTDAQRLVDWMNRDKEQIKEHLIAEAVKVFDADIRTKWNFPVINAVPRTIKRLSQAYRLPPERELTDKAGDVIPKTNTKAYDNLKRLYEAFDPNSRLKDSDRYGTLLNTVHLEVVPRNKGIDWDLRLRPTTTVLQHPDDFRDFIKFAHYWEAVDPDTESLDRYKGWIYWSEEEHYLIREDSRAKIGMSREDASNPYRDKDGLGVIPVVTIRKLEQDDYWGRFGSDLVDIVELANIQLGNLYRTGLIQTAGIPILINCNTTSGQTITLGPSDPISANDVTKDDVEPAIKFAHPEPDIEGVMKFVDWMNKTAGAAEGLPPSAWALDEKRMSGFAKYLDNLELLENREDELETWERIETNLFEKSRIVFNRWAKDWGKKPIDETLGLKVTFPAIQFPEAPKEKAERLIAEFGAGINDPVNYFMEAEGLTEADATAKATKIATNLAKLKRAGAGSALKDLLGGKNIPPELAGEVEEEGAAAEAGEGENGEG